MLLAGTRGASQPLHAGGERARTEGRQRHGAAHGDARGTWRHSAASRRKAPQPSESTLRGLVALWLR